MSEKVLTIMLNQCGTKVYSNDPDTRDYDRARYGHAVHECTTLTEPGKPHTGFHVCSCFLTWEGIPVTLSSSEGDVTTEQWQNLRNRLSSTLCVQAGWAFGVPEDGRKQWLDEVVKAVKEELANGAHAASAQSHEGNT